MFNMHLKNCKVNKVQRSKPKDLLCNTDLLRPKPIGA